MNIKKAAFKIFQTITELMLKTQETQSTSPIRKTNKSFYLLALPIPQTITSLNVSIRVISETK